MGESQGVCECHPAGIRIDKYVDSLIYYFFISLYFCLDGRCFLTILLSLDRSFSWLVLTIGKSSHNPGGTQGNSDF